MRFKKANALFKGLISMTLIVFVSVFVFADLLRVSSSDATVVGLPQPGSLLKLSNDYQAPIMKGLKLDLDNPLNIDFMIDTGDESDISQEDAARLIRYFMAALTVPEEELWVNLSPYENDRIASDTLSDTDIGRDLLAQDYILKQLSSSLTDPDTALGKEYWSFVSGQSTDNFNKIWIVPGQVGILENKNIAVIEEASLNVMTETDYLAMSTNQVSEANNSTIKDLLLPKIREEVNYGKNFSLLRQVYRSILLGMWFKIKFQDSFYKEYFNEAKLDGIDLDDNTIREKIYAQYVKAFEKGVYDKIKKVYDPLKKTKVKRRYFSGGAKLNARNEVKNNTHEVSLDNISSAINHSKTRIVSSSIETVTEKDITIGDVISISIKEMKDINLKGYHDFLEAMRHVPANVHVVSVDASKLGTINDTNGHAATTFIANIMRDEVSKWLYSQSEIVGQEPGDNSDEFRFIFPVTWSQQKIADKLNELNLIIQEKLEAYEQLYIEVDMTANQEVELELAKAEEYLDYVYFAGKNAGVVFKKGDKRAIEFFEANNLLVGNYRSDLWVPYLYMGVAELSAADIESKGVDKAITDVANIADLVGEISKNDENGNGMIAFESEVVLEQEKFAKLPLSKVRLEVAKINAKERLSTLNKLNEKRKEQKLARLKLDKKVGVLNRYSLATVVAEMLKPSTAASYMVCRAPPNEFFIVRKSQSGEVEVFYLDTLYYEKNNVSAVKFEETGRMYLRQLDAALSTKVDGNLNAQGIKVMNLSFGHEQVDDLILFQADVIDTVFDKYSDDEKLPKEAISEMAQAINAEFVNKANGFGTVVLTSKMTYSDLIANEADLVEEYLQENRHKDLSKEENMILAGLMLDRIQQMIDARSFILPKSLVYNDKKNIDPDVPVVIKSYKDYLVDPMHRGMTEAAIDHLKQIKFKRGVEIIKAKQEVNKRRFQEQKEKKYASSGMVDKKEEVEDVVNTAILSFFREFFVKYPRANRTKKDRESLKRIWTGLNFMKDINTLDYDIEEFLYVADTLLSNMPEKKYGVVFVVLEETFYAMRMLDMLRKGEIQNDMIMSIENEPGNVESTRMVAVSRRGDGFYRKFTTMLKNVNEGLKSSKKTNNVRVEFKTDEFSDFKKKGVRKFEIALGSERFNIYLKEIVQVTSKDERKLPNSYIKKLNIDNAAKVAVQKDWDVFFNNFSEAEHTDLQLKGIRKPSPEIVENLKDARYYVNIASRSNLNSNISRLGKVYKISDESRREKEPLIGMKFTLTYDVGDNQTEVNDQFRRNIRAGFLGFDYASLSEVIKNTSINFEFSKEKLDSLIDEAIEFAKVSGNSPWTSFLSYFMDNKIILKTQLASFYLKILDGVEKAIKLTLEDDNSGDETRDFRANLKEASFFTDLSFTFLALPKESQSSIDIETFMNGLDENLYKDLWSAFGDKATNEKVENIRTILSLVAKHIDEMPESVIEKNGDKEVKYPNVVRMFLAEPTIWEDFVINFIEHDLSLEEALLKGLMPKFIGLLKIPASMWKGDIAGDIVSVYSGVLSSSKGLDTSFDFENAPKEEPVVLFLESDMSLAQFLDTVEKLGDNLAAIVVCDPKKGSASHYAEQLAAERNIPVVIKPYVVTDSDFVLPFDLVFDGQQILVEQAKRILTPNPNEEDYVNYQFSRLAEQAENEYYKAHLHDPLKTEDGQSFEFAINVTSIKTIERLDYENVGEIAGAGLVPAEMFLIENKKAMTTQDWLDKVLGPLAKKIKNFGGRFVTFRLCDRQHDELDPKDWSSSVNNELYGIEYILDLVKNDHPEIRSQIEAALLAHDQYGLVELEVPMLSTAEQYVTLKNYIDSIKLSLLADGKIAQATFDNFKFGAMFETPESFDAETIYKLREAGLDVAAIGHNDLTTLNNEKDGINGGRGGDSGKDMKSLRMREMDQIEELILSNTQYGDMDIKLCGAINGTFAANAWIQWRKKMFKKTFNKQVAMIPSVNPTEIPRLKQLTRLMNVKEGSEVSDLMYKLYNDYNHADKKIDSIFSGEMSTIYRGVMEDVKEGADDFFVKLQKEMLRNSLLDKAKAKENSSALGRKTGGVDLAGADIESRIAEGSSAIELASVELGDFSGFTFMINGIRGFDSQNKFLVYLQN